MAKAGCPHPGCRSARSRLARWLLASAAVLGLGDGGWPGVAAAVIGLGLVGSPFVLRLGGRRAES
jgi:hypothetical protein